MTRSLLDAVATIMAFVEPSPPQAVAADAAAGRVAAAHIVSAHDLPPFENSAMDGFAVRSADTILASPATPLLLPIAAGARAGSPATEPLGSGWAARISTGAMVPAGADAVVRVEDVTLDGDNLRLVEPVHRGTNVRPAGDDIRAGAVVVRAGTRLRAGELAMIAALGRVEVSVHQLPTLAVITTGDEVVPAGQPLQPGQIHESNSVMLSAQAREAGAIVTSVTGGVADTLAATAAAIDRALDEAEIVVIAGGVSMGEHDHVKPALDQLGVTESFWRVALRPGHPTWFGTIVRDGRRRLVFGLPGNPVSAYVTFQLFVVPVIDRIGGLQRPPIEIPATYSGPTQHKQMGVSLALRCRIDSGPFGVLALLTTQKQRSHIIGSLVGADGLAIVPPGRERLEDGDQVMVRLTRTL